MSDLDGFHPTVADWFARELGEPTPPQVLGWPRIRAGEHTLILSPTGSGKTLAAFLVCIDALIRAERRPPSLTEDLSPPARGRRRPRVPGPMVLYVSPLKALNYDIERNLRRPLRGIRESAARLGLPLPDIEVAVRTGDTTPQERQRMLRHPPDILITTPESLHLMLTGRAREMLRCVEYCIVDEIHSVCSGKRGVFLSLLLERLRHECGREFVRVGLSATMQPLEIVAGFLGGQCRGESGRLEPRPVTIVNAGQRRELDVRVVCPEANRRVLAGEEQPGTSAWPAIYDELLRLVQAHRTTIVFTNSRQHAERIARELNDLAGERIAYPHHGSVAPEIRREIEEALKQGRIPAVVATGTLELGIDMGDVDLVCQVGSPTTVSRGLQRVGRAGHLMSKVSKGRILPTHRANLLEASVLAADMLEGRVEPVRVPRNCLDVLAQQLVAMVSVEPASVDALYEVVRGSYCYRDLGREHFDSVVAMIAGRYACDAWINLSPRVSLDPARDVLEALPGAQNVALVNGGTIPETGQYRVCLAGSSAAIGEVDEQFVAETRIGDVFPLGTSTWKIRSVDADRVMVVPASSAGGRMPFWLGETVGRPAPLGERIARFIEEASGHAESAASEDDAIRWAMARCPVDATAAEALLGYVRAQQERGAALPTPGRVPVERYRETDGTQRLAILTLRGARFNNTLRIAIAGYCARRYGTEIASTHTDDGVVLQVPDTGAPLPTDILDEIDPDGLYDLVLDSLATSMLFGMRFRENAARALLLPGSKPGRRTPLWLQRLKAKDLLRIVKDFDAFPVVVETYRECLEDYLDVAGCAEFLRDIRAGRIHVVASSLGAPSPFVASMVWRNQDAHVYETDEPPQLRHSAAQSGERQQLAALLEGAELRRELDERAVEGVSGRLQGTATGWQARTAAELYELVRRLGDLTDAELRDRIADRGHDLAGQLQRDGRLVRVTIPGVVNDPERWTTAEHAERLAQGFAGSGDAAVQAWVRRRLATNAYLTAEGLHQRYGVDLTQAERVLEHLAGDGLVVRFRGPGGEALDRYGQLDHVEDVYRATLAIGRREAKPVSLTRYAEFLMDFQHLSPECNLVGQDGLQTAMDQLAAIPLPASLWETEVLPRRVTDYRAEWLDDLLSGGVLMWRGYPLASANEGKLAFYFRDEYETVALTATEPADGPLPRRIRSALEELGPSYLREIAREAREPEPAVLQVLWDMLWHGEVTQEDLRAIRRGRPSRDETILSPNDPAPPLRDRVAQASPPVVSQPGLTGRDAGATGPGPRRTTRLPATPIGRWVLLPPAGEGSGLDVPDDVRLEAIAWMLLRRYGVLARALLALEDLPLAWGALYDVCQRLEMQGLILRGYFVEGLEGAQFALPDVPDRLKRAGSAASVLLNACDPANIHGSAGVKVVKDTTSREVPLSRVPTNWLILHSGVPEVVIELAAGRLTFLSRGAESHALSLLTPFAELCGRPAPQRPFKRAQLSLYGDVPIMGSPAEAPLRALGFQTDGQSLVYAGPVGPQPRTADDEWRLPRRRAAGAHPRPQRPPVRSPRRR